MSPTSDFELLGIPFPILIISNFKRERKSICFETEIIIALRREGLMFRDEETCSGAFSKFRFTSRRIVRFVKKHRSYIFGTYRVF